MHVPIAPPFDFNAAGVARHSPEVTGRMLLVDMCARLGWPSLAGRKLLDFGCGVRFVRTIINLEMEIDAYAGVDANGDSIAWLKANIDDPRFRFEHLPMGNPLYNPTGMVPSRSALAELGLAGFDAACMFSVITHQDPTNAALIFSMLHPCATKLYFTALIDDEIAGYCDKDPSRPCLYAAYPTRLIREIAEASGWQVEGVFPPGRFQQTGFVCSRRS